MSTTTTVRRVLAGIAIGGAALLAMAIAEPEANASPAQDEALFVSLVDEYGAPIGLVLDDLDVAVSQGRAACTLLDDGYSLDVTAAAVDEVLPVYRSGANVIVAAAVVAFCPWHAPAGTAV